MRMENLSGGEAGLQYPASRLTLAPDFGANPGNLRMFRHVPDAAGQGSPLLVMLHGCTQTARGYDQGAGWSVLAERYGFALLAPEQSRLNNPNGCLNWFLPEDITRGSGEVESIREMIARMLDNHGLDPNRVFITGLSAGGAMTSAMLAAYPELFAGGAIIAGLPAGAANNLAEALAAMHRTSPRAPGSWGNAVRTASAHKGPWPRVSVWHGDADATVAVSNMDAILTQWREVHGLDGAAQEDRDASVTHRVWRDRRGAALIEAYAIAGLGHGTPIKPGSGDDAAGEAMPFMLDAGISSSHRIADFFGLTAKAAAPTPKPVRKPAPRVVEPVREILAARQAVALAEAESAPSPQETLTAQTETRAGHLRRIIDAALKAAGLVKDA
jgi:poly(hydroxyalkanoate) depolymerase family esterase